VLHDAVHGSISGSHPSLRWVNESLGYLAAWILMIPLTAHRHEHLAHHRNTNQPQADPDYVVADMARSPWHALRAAMRVVAGQYSYYIRQRWSVAPRAQNVRFCLEIAFAVGLRLAFLAQGFWAEGALLFISAGLGGVMVLMFLFAYIVHCPHEAVGRYVDTSTIIIPGVLSRPLTWLWGFQNYHAIHHLFPRVPFYHYRRVFDQIGAIMVARGAPVYQLGWGSLQPLSSLAPQTASVRAG
jgi:beta-carotene hydroxylase